MHDQNVKKATLEAVSQINGIQRGDNTIVALSKKNVLNTADIMMLFNISERSVARWRKKRKLKFIKPGRYYYLWDDILLLLISEYNLG
jgi:hypothetical protein